MSGSTSSSTIPKPKFDVGAMIAGWKVLESLGEGGFGTVWTVEKDGVRAACKTEFVSDEHSQLLKKEVLILRYMQWSQHFCKLFAHGAVAIDNTRVNVMIMTLLGEPLSRKRRQCPAQHFSRSTAIRLGIQCLEAVRDLHMTGFLHRDVKAGNFAWHAAERRVYMLDMGFSRQYLIWKDASQTEVIKRPLRKKASFLGTTRYASPNVHKRRDQGRRDDLWALLYTIVEFHTGALPWRNDSDRVTGEKKERIGSRLMRGCPFELFIFHDHVRALSANDKPNYALLLSSLRKVCTRCSYSDADPYDFEPGGKHYDFITENARESHSEFTESDGTDDDGENRGELDEDDVLLTPSAIVDTD